MQAASTSIPLPALKLPRSLGVSNFAELVNLVRSELDVDPLAALQAMAADAVWMREAREERSRKLLEASRA